jgi:TatD DNase family protein
MPNIYNSVVLVVSGFNQNAYLQCDRATKIRAVATHLPLQSLVLETDSPNIPPVAFHGQRNSPEYLPVILLALVNLRKESVEKIAEQTTENAENLLHLQVS